MLLEAVNCGFQDHPGTLGRRPVGIDAGQKKGGIPAARLGGRATGKGGLAQIILVGESRRGRGDTDVSRRQVVVITGAGMGLNPLPAGGGTDRRYDGILSPGATLGSGWRRATSRPTAHPATPVDGAIKALGISSTTNRNTASLQPRGHTRHPCQSTCLLGCRSHI
jgi:hypothetical protein